MHCQYSYISIYMVEAIDCQSYRSTYGTCVSRPLDKSMGRYVGDSSSFPPYATERARVCK